ncbi:MAG TPA: hypothetical protein DDY13_13735 [Cytophagales bacterium]|jgi:hypothetical protein|nr:hypothetical protein [Cytophagales bacterium]
MKKQFEEHHIVEYLYGEMSPADKKDFEEAMTQNPELENEVKAIQQVRETIGEMPEKEVVPPEIPYARLAFKDQKATQGWIKPLLAVAASIALLLVAGMYAEIHVRINDAGWYVGFGNPAPNDYVAKSEVENIVKEALQKQQASFSQQLTQTRDSVQRIYAALGSYEGVNAGSINREIPAKAVSENELRQQMASMQSTNRELLQNYLSAVNDQQQAYLQDALTQFSDYLQQQREEDLLMIQRNLIDLKAYQDAQKQETNQVLADIMQTVNRQE